jgi:hypothetical protein
MPAPTPPAPRPLHLFVVACGAAKLDHPAPARDLYTGAHFRYVLAGVEREAVRTAQACQVDTRVLILSAEHGLVDLDTELAPYDRTITDVRSVGVYRIADQLVDQAGGRLDDDLADEDGVPRLEVYAFLPRDYLTRLRAGADVVAVPVFDVFEGCTGIGEQRHVIASLAALISPAAAGLGAAGRVGPPR